MQRAQRDDRLAASIVGRRRILYSQGADAALDRPAHVRAASGIAWLGDRLALIQDDAHFIALVDPHTGAAHGIPLPADATGKRLFDDTRGTKHLKLDLEACFSVQTQAGAQLIAFGSGSKPLRERIVQLRYDERAPLSSALSVIDATSLYRMLHQDFAFSGSELNLEGALVRDDVLVLVQRGNGAPCEGRTPVNALGELSWSAFVRYLESAGTSAPPSLTRSTQYDLGSIASVPYTFTDACLAADRSVLFLAGAENSSSAVTDGAVHGTAFGVIARDGSARMTPLLDERGQLSRAKAEGLVLDRADPTRAWAVVDMDDPALASELLELRLTLGA